MVITLSTVLMFIALIVFILAAINVTIVRVSLIGLGLALLTAAFLAAPLPV
jgi:hypothetical protein